MEIAKGYKHTEDGIIPNDWEVKVLYEISDFLDVKRKPIKDVDRSKMQGRYPYYGASGIIDYVNDFLFDEDLILLGEDGENIISRSVRLAFHVKGKIWVNNHAHVIKPKNGINIIYLTEKLESINYERYNTGTAQPKLNQNVCSKIPIALPPTLREQTAIATALSDTHALISSLEKLIAKKRNIKQGTMQVLFGAIDKSNLISVNELTGFHKQGYYTQETYKSNGKFYLLRGTDMQNPKIDLSSTPKIDANERDFLSYKVEMGDFLFVRSGAIGRYGIVKNKIDALFGSYLINFRFHNDKLLNDYFGYFYESEFASQQLMSITQGSSNININAENIKSLKIPLPSLEEQGRIALVLSDMDSEISALEHKLSKYRQIKSGMMHNLLTGKIRLV